jgi:hypothetical protein
MEEAKIQNILEEQSSTFVEYLSEETLLDLSDATTQSTEASFGDNVKQFSSYMTHELVDEIMSYYEEIPESLELVKRGMIQSFLMIIRFVPRFFSSVFESCPLFLYIQLNL